MYALNRLIRRLVKESDNWVEYVKRYDKEVGTLYISDEDFDFLNSLPKEYDYITYDNELYVDRHPDLIKEGVESQEFIDDYSNNVSDKFFVLYEYKKVEDV